jgi:CubicO group peptidase (beta-lactamase class C family)
LKSPGNIFLLLLCTFATACHVFRAISYLGPDPADKNKLPKATIPASPTPFYFARNGEGISKAKYDFIEKNLLHSNTDALLVIQNDSIVYEYYSRGYGQASLFLGFSLSKAFVSTLTGIAIDEGYIKSSSEKIIQYIPEFRHSEPSLQNVTIQQLLDMRSGIIIDESRIGLNSPMTRYYYGTSVNRELFRLKAADSSRFEYKNVNTQLLSLIIERATGQKFLDYFREKLWFKIGAEYPAEWIIDDHVNNTPKAFFGLIASARDYAKLGSLYLEKGSSAAHATVSDNWVNLCRNMDTLLKYEYKNHFWANNISHNFPSDSAAKKYLEDNSLSAHIKSSGGNRYCVNLKGDSFIAEGLFDQYIYINPQKNLVIVRLGKAVPEGKPEMDNVITRLGSAF